MPLNESKSTAYRVFGTVRSSLTLLEKTLVFHFISKTFNTVKKKKHATSVALYLSNGRFVRPTCVVNGLAFACEKPFEIEINRRSKQLRFCLEKVKNAVF